MGRVANKVKKVLTLKKKKKEERKRVDENDAMFMNTIALPEGKAKHKRKKKKKRLSHGVDESTDDQPNEYLRIPGQGGERKENPLFEAQVSANAFGGAVDVGTQTSRQGSRVLLMCGCEHHHALDKPAEEPLKIITVSAAAHSDPQQDEEAMTCTDSVLSVDRESGAAESFTDPSPLCIESESSTSPAPVKKSSSVISLKRKAPPPVAPKPSKRRSVEGGLGQPVPVAPSEPEAPPLPPPPTAESISEATPEAAPETPAQAPAKQEMAAATPAEMAAPAAVDPARAERRRLLAERRAKRKLEREKFEQETLDSALAIIDTFDEFCDDED